MSGRNSHGENVESPPDSTRPLPSSGRKDLQDLRNLPRLPLAAFVKKHSRPKAPRIQARRRVPLADRYPILAAFAPHRTFMWIWEYLIHRVGRRHPFQSYAPSDPDQGIYQLARTDDVRIALAGDWASGTDEAEHVAARIRAFHPHYSIHLGDVYYVGSPDEVDENFLGINNPHNGYAPCVWPKGSLGSFALNGNHEMYARGYAYFDKMLPLLGPMTKRGPAGQKASFFCLENEFWRFIALDTGYNSIGWPLWEYVFQPDGGLRPEQIDWLRDTVKLRRDDPRAIVLLTHHQYYSRFEQSYPRQAAQLAPFISRPVLWFWGHEHRLTIYRENGRPNGIRAFGRCIGHGGLPVELPPEKPKHPECEVEFIDRRRYANDENLMIGFNGFAQLTLRGRSLRVQYVDLTGCVVFEEAWRADDGALRRVE